MENSKSKRKTELMSISSKNYVDTASIIIYNVNEIRYLCLF